MTIKNCENCSKEFKAYPNNEAIRRFCSFDCRKSIYTPEMKQKMSEIKKEQYANGLEPWNKGLSVQSNTALAEYREANGGFKGENHPNWKGGVAYHSVRARRLRENGGSHTMGDWTNMKAQYNWTCPSCDEQEPEIELVRDHIIPIAQGGSDNIENIQPLCRSCNAQKHTDSIMFLPDFRAKYFKVDHKRYDY